MILIFSDFLMMKDCNTIHFGDLDNVKKVSKQNKSLKVIVWNRSALARSYGIEDELRFVYWAVLVGNDFTGHFSSALLGLGTSELTKSKDRLLEAFVNNTISWNPATSILDEECRQAVFYSIAFYQLEDLTPFMLERYKTVNQLEEVPDIEEGLRLSKEMKSALSEFCSSSSGKGKQKQKNNISNSGVEMAKLVLSFLGAGIEGGQSYVGNIVTKNHIDTLKKMLEAIAEKKIESNFKGSKLYYIDQKVANLFQLLIREIEKKLREVPSKTGKPFKPSECYDGVTFHNLMNEFHVAEDAEGLSQAMNKMKIQDSTPAPASAPAPQTSSKKKDKTPAAPPKNALPADAYRDQILRQIEKDRVTIIHGETG